MEGHTEGVGEGVTAAVISTPSGHIGPIYIRWAPSLLNNFLCVVLQKLLYNSVHCAVLIGF